MTDRCTRVSEGEAPLRTFEDTSAFKLYMADTGLLASRFEALPSDVEPGNDKAARFRGALAENYVFQQLRATGSEVHYWGTASRAEVEFVARVKSGNVVPIEAKSGKNMRSKSLEQFRQKYASPLCIRVSARNFGEENGIRSAPSTRPGF